MRTFLKQTALVLTLAAGPAAWLAAQTANAPVTPAPAGIYQHKPHDPAKETKHLMKKLGLSADQASQVEPILANARSQADAVRNDTTLDKATRRQRLMAIHADAESKMNGILTDAQRQQLATMMAERHHGHKSDGAAPVTPPSA